MDVIILIVLVVLLLAALGPRAGWYGTASVLLDLRSLVVFIILMIWLVRLLVLLVF